jgi:hypothetical protein
MAIADDLTAATTTTTTTSGVLTAEEDLRHWPVRPLISACSFSDCCGSISMMKDGRFVKIIARSHVLFSSLPHLQ